MIIYSSTKVEHVQWESKEAGPLGGVEGQRPSWGFGGNAPDHPI